MEEIIDPAVSTDGISSESASTSLPILENKPTRRRVWQTSVRESLIPWLPPPVARGIHSIDAALLDHVGPEATITLTITLFLGWCTVAFLQRCLSRRGRAIKTVESDPLKGGKDEHYDATVLLIGPRNSGKTRLFYQMCHSEHNMPTVSSIKPNVGVWTTADQIKLRVVDWPGHAPILEVLRREEARNAGAALRIILVLDATQSVAAAAEVLWQLVQTTSTTKRRTPLPVLVACHKRDLPKAKNDKRIKIQLRTELERQEVVDLDELPGVQLFFVTTSCVDATLSDEWMEFCRTGTVAAAVS